MFEGFNPTKKEREAIARAFNWVRDNTRDPYRCERFCKDERRGYGNPSDAVPLAAAQGMCVKWFLDGVDAPLIELRDVYYMRPAAIWFMGLGAELSTRKGSAMLLIGGDLHSPLRLLRAGVDAYNAAFDRMYKKDVVEFNKLAQALSQAVQEANQ